jgi:hypothetical protein
MSLRVFQLKSYPIEIPPVGRNDITPVRLSEAKRSRNIPHSDWTIIFPDYSNHISQLNSLAFTCSGKAARAHQPPNHRFLGWTWVSLLPILPMLIDGEMPVDGDGAAGLRRAYPSVCSKKADTSSYSRDSSASVVMRMRSSRRVINALAAKGLGQMLGLQNTSKNTSPVC